MAMDQQRDMDTVIRSQLGYGRRFGTTTALRWEGSGLKPGPDAVWLGDFPDTPVTSVAENGFTPRFGLLFHGPENWNFYIQYARGFRAPPFEDANIGLDIPLFGYRAIPNPELKSETSDGFEFGARRNASGARFSLAAFHTDYDDFIETRALIGGERFRPRSWVRLDLTGGWRCASWLELRAGVFNLGDKTYWRWLDVANLVAGDPMVALMSRPGRSYSVTARLSF